MAQDELKPCPFCGGEAYISDDSDAMYMVHCYECKAELGYFKSGDEAVKKWNRRVIIFK